MVHPWNNLVSLQDRIRQIIEQKEARGFGIRLGSIVSKEIVCDHRLEELTRVKLPVLDYVPNDFDVEEELSGI